MRVAPILTAATLALALTACGGQETAPAETPTAPSETATETATPTATDTPPETTAPTEDTAEAATEAPAETTTGTPDPANEPAPTTDGGYIEVDSYDENGDPTSWTEYDAAGNPIGAAVGGPPPGQDTEFDYETAVQDPESVYYGMTPEEAQTIDEYVWEGLGGDEGAPEWLAWYECTNQVYLDHVDTYPTDGTEAEIDAYYDTDTEALELEQCGPEPA